VLLTSIWDIHPEPLRAWVSSAANFEGDSARTFSLSHPAGAAPATIGTRQDWPYRMALTVDGERLSVAVDGEALLAAADGAFTAGAAGFLIDEGTVYADDFEVTS
jgi:hypothetical protein